MEIQAILKRLERNEGRFPRDAVEEAIAARDQITPELLNIIEYAKQNVEELTQDGDYMAHMYAMYLLAQFREERAYPAIVDLFSIPGEGVLEATGDLVTEDLDRILASVSNGDTRLMECLVEDEEVNGYARAAALDGMVVSVARGEKPREEVMAYFRTLCRGKLIRKHSHVWNGLVSRSAVLSLEELLDDIKQAYREQLVEESYINLERG